MGRLLSISVRNFMSWREAHLDLENLSGVVAVEGPTGAGKTALLVEAPSWLLWGKPIRSNVRAHDIMLVRHRLPGETVVRGVWERDDGSTFVIERSRSAKGATFNVADMKRGTATGTQETLEDMLGMDRKTFSSCVVFGGPDMSSFCRLGDTERKMILERLLSVEDYVRAGERATRLRNEVTAELDVVQDRHNESKRTSVQLRDEIQRLKALNAEWDTRRRERLRSKESEAKAAKEALTAHVAAHRIAKRDAANKKRQEKARRNIWRDRVAQSDETLQRLLSTEGEASSDVKHARNVRDEAEEALSRIKKDTLPEVCPFCSTKRDDWPNPKRAAVSPEAPMKRLRETKRALSAVSRAHLRIEEQVTLAREAVRAARLEEPEHYDSSGVTESQQQVEVLTFKLKTARAEVKHARRDADNPYLPLIRERRTDLASVRISLKARASKVRRLVGHQKVYSYWSTGFSRQGIPGMLLDEAAPFLTQRATTYAQHLTNGSISISFDPAGAKRHQSFTPLIRNTKGGGSYWLSSKGQRALIDTCVLLALRDLMEARSSSKFSQIILDEILDGLDDELSERAVVMLRKALKNKTVFLITHSESIKAVTDSVIQITQDRKGISHLEVH